MRPEPHSSSFFFFKLVNLIINMTSGENVRKVYHTHVKVESQQERESIDAENDSDLVLYSRLTWVHILATHLYIKPIQQTTQARTITPRTVAAVPAGEPPEAVIKAHWKNEKE